MIHLTTQRRIVLVGFLATIGVGLWAVQARPTNPIDSYAACTEAGYPVSDSNPPYCNASGHAYRGPFSSPTPTPPVQTTQPFEILVQGDSRGSYPRGQELIASQLAWDSYWRRVHAALPEVPPLITTDFSTSYVIALSSGPQPTTGYNLKITSVTTSTAGTTVNITQSIPTITCAVSATPTNRYFIGRTAKFPLPVTFRISTDYRHCN